MATTDIETLVECSECGHLHFDTKTREYVECPLRSEGCTCPFAGGTVEEEETQFGVCAHCGETAVQTEDGLWIHLVEDFGHLVRLEGAPVKHWADHCPTAKSGDILHAPEDEADCTTCSPAAIDASEPCCITASQTRGAQHHVTCEEY